MGKKGRNRLVNDRQEVKSAQPVKIPGLTLVNPSEDNYNFVGQALLDTLDALEEKSINSKRRITNWQPNKNTGSLAKGRKSKAPKKRGRLRKNTLKDTIGNGQSQHLPVTTGENEHEYNDFHLFNVDEPSPATSGPQTSQVATGNVAYQQQCQQDEDSYRTIGTGMAFQFQSTWPSVQPSTALNQHALTDMSAQGLNNWERQVSKSHQTNEDSVLYDTSTMQSYAMPMYTTHQWFPQAEGPDNITGIGNPNEVFQSRWAISQSSINKMLPKPKECQRYNLRGQKSPGSPPTPKPTETYLLQSSTAPKQSRVTVPQKLLIILDLNGVLLFRPNRKNPKNFTPRKHLKEFLDYLFANHKVMIWSSARPENVTAMCQRIFTEEQRENLVAEWARDKLRLTTGQYDNKVQVYKQLSWVWEDSSVQRRAKSRKLRQRKWNQSNTVLLDDTALKAAAEPYNLIEVPEFGPKGDNYNDGVLVQVAGYLEELKYAGNASYFMRTRPFVVDGGWKFQWPNQ